MATQHWNTEALTETIYSDIALFRMIEENAATEFVPCGWDASDLESDDWDGVDFDEPDFEDDEGGNVGWDDSDEIAF